MNRMQKMQKYKKRILLILLFLLSLQLCGCGKKKASSPLSQKSRTLFIYMCGSNLETKNGAAGKNIDELLAADIGDDMNIVIETGGAAQWKSHDIRNDVLSRYEVRDGELKLIETLENASMGEAETLSDFLSWGKENYLSENNILILWDHGSGPVNGVCFDENYRFDPLTLTELKEAFGNAGPDVKFSIIGFDACLMANIETASVVSDHADYMVASEEIEPPGGWDYKALAETFASGEDGLELGKKICDSYMEKSASYGKENYATLAVYDLSLMNGMIEWFNKVVVIIRDALGDKTSSQEMMHGLTSCDRFGGNNSYQGRSNLIDLLDIFNHTPYIGGDLTGLWDMVDRFVPYTVHGDSHTAYGLSFYYPVLYEKNEIEEYIALGIFDEYSSFLQDYYLDIPDKTVEYADQGSITSNGNFSVSLTSDSMLYLCTIDYLLMKTDSSGELHILRTDNDIFNDQDGITYENRFSGYSPALEGHEMFSAAIMRTEYDVGYSAPVIVNGERTSLFFDYDLPSEYDEEETEGHFIPVGLWGGYDENGLPDGDMTALCKGDRVQVITDITYSNGEVTENWSEEFTIGEVDDAIKWMPLSDDKYEFVYVIKDVFGNTFMSDMATFEASKKDEADPVPSFKVTDIQPYTLGYIPDN